MRQCQYAGTLTIPMVYAYPSVLTSPDGEGMVGWIGSTGQIYSSPLQAVVVLIGNEYRPTFSGVQHWTFAPSSNASVPRPQQDGGQLQVWGSEAFAGCIRYDDAGNLQPFYLNFDLTPGGATYLDLAMTRPWPKNEGQWYQSCLNNANEHWDAYNHGVVALDAQTPAFLQVLQRYQQGTAALVFSRALMARGFRSPLYSFVGGWAPLTSVFCPDFRTGSNYMVSPDVQPALTRFHFSPDYSQLNIDSALEPVLFDGGNPLWGVPPYIRAKPTPRGFIFACGPSGYLLMARDGSHFVQLVFQYPDGRVQLNQNVTVDENGTWWANCQDARGSSFYHSDLSQIRTDSPAPALLPYEISPIALPCHSPCISANVCAAVLKG